MMKPVYIRSACTISPQNSFEPQDFLKEVRHSSDGKLFVTDPDYRQFINPVAIRRMSRMIKMGITAGMKCLQEADIQGLTGIITGTGRGSMSDMERFLTDMIDLEEQALNPTFFIQSTYNSINGWLAMQAKCTGYNQTYVNRGSSLELALLDAQMLLQEAEQKAYYLVGCFDEMTPDYFIVKDKVNYWKKDIPNSLDLLQHSDTPGTIGGEGAAFFTISNDSENALAILAGLQTLLDPSAKELTQAINSLLQDCNIKFEDIDVVLCGMNGDSRHQYLYDTTMSLLPEDTSVAAFKHLTGEYDTATGFALWLSAQMLKNNSLPTETIFRKGNTEGIQTILMVNHYILNSVTIAIVQK